MKDVLERNKESKKVNGHFSTIPWPNDKYLRRIGNKTDETKSEADEEPSEERMHAFTTGAGKVWKRTNTNNTVTYANIMMLRKAQALPSYGVRFNSTAANRHWVDVMLRQYNRLLCSTCSSYKYSKSTTETKKSPKEESDVASGFELFTNSSPRQLSWETSQTNTSQ